MNLKLIKGKFTAVVNLDCKTDLSFSASFVGRSAMAQKDLEQASSLARTALRARLPRSRVACQRFAPRASRIDVLRKKTVAVYSKFGKITY